MAAAVNSSIEKEGGASAPPSGVNGARPRALFNPNLYRLDAAARASQQSREAALSLAQAGLYIFPCKPDKTPLAGLHWQTESTTDATKIEMWWARHPGAIPAVDCQKSGIVALDLDRHGDGPDGVAAGEGLLSDLHALNTPITLTRNDGKHIYFAAPPGEPIGNSPGSLPGGIDVRSRGYVLAPGAMLADGTGWASDPNAPDLAEAFAAGAIPELPQHVLDLIRTRPERPERPEPPRQRAEDGPRTTVGDIGERERAFANAALAACAADVAGTGAGGRNVALNGAAYRMGRQIAAGRIGRAEVERALEAACEANGLARADGWASIRKTLASGIEAGMQNPAAALVDRERPDTRERRETPHFTKRDHHDGPQPGEAEGESADQSAGGKQPDPLRGFSFDGDAAPEPPKMLVKGLIGDKEIAFVGGQSGAGKTFIVLDLAVSLASGEVFFGRMVKERVGVAIFAGEGSATIPNRLIVAKNAKVGDEPLPIAWLGEVPDLKRPSEVAAMIPRLRAVDDHFRETFGVRLGVVVCDTLAATFNLDDEDDNSEAAQTIRIMKGLVDKLGVTVVPVHHFGKATDTGLRGASGWRAGCDTVLAVLANRDQTTGRCDNRRLALSKSRVSEEGLTIPFSLRFVALGLDEDGDEYGSCFVEPGTGFNAADEVLTKKEAGPPRAARVFLDALGVVIGEQGSKVRPFGFGGPEVAAVDREIVRGEFYKLWPADGETDKAKAEARRKSFARGEDWALSRKKVATYELAGKQLLWLLKEPAQ